MAYNLSSNDLVQCRDALQLRDAGTSSADTTQNDAAQPSSSSSQTCQSKSDVVTEEDGDPEPRNAVHKCMNCNEPARLRCPSCEYDEETEIKRPTWYCGKSCQAIDWKTHKARCIQTTRLNHLYRAARVAQSAFYCFRKNVFDLNITRIDVSGGTIHLHAGAYDERVTHDFPDHLISDSAVRDALLSHLSCNDAMVLMHSLFRGLSKGTYKGVKQLTVDLKNNKLSVCTVASKNAPIFVQDYAHEVLGVTVKGGAIYVIDIAGAQYGYRQAVWRWEDYASQRMRCTQKVKPFAESEIYDFSFTHAYGEPAMDAVLANVPVLGHLIKARFEAQLDLRERSVTIPLRAAKTTADASVIELATVLCTLISDTISDASSTKDIIVAVTNSYLPLSAERPVFIRGDGSRSYSAREHHLDED